MTAIVKISGKQFRVQKDQTLYVPHVSGNSGDVVEFSDVLLSHQDNNLLTGSDVRAIVKAEIVGHVKDDKVIAFKMKRRKGYRKNMDTELISQKSGLMKLCDLLSGIE